MAPKSDPVALLLAFEPDFSGVPTVLLGGGIAEHARLAAWAHECGAFVLARDVRQLHHLEMAQVDVEFGVSTAVKAEGDVIVVFEQSKSLLDFELELAHSLAPEGSAVWVVGPKRGGINAAGERMERLFGNVEKVETAKRSALYRSTVTTPPAAPFELDRWFERFEVGEGDDVITIESMPGVFSHGRLDDGTAVLLRHLPKLDGAKVLDVCCGAGVLGAVAARAGARQVVLTDASAFAVEAANRTIARHSFKGHVVVQPADVYRGVRGRYDVILCNPPFHRGRSTEYLVADAVIHGAADKLAQSGEIRVVANRHLDYRAHFDEVFTTFDEVADEGGFRVYRAFGRHLR